MQLGDGELLSVRRSESDGAIGPLSIERPLPADPSLLANETTSLSQPQAATQVRLCCLPIGGWPPGLVMLATDGYPNSFESPAGFDQAASDLVNALDEEGPAAVAAVLPGWLEETSLLGSGDDISVALLYSPLRHSPLTEEAPQP